MRGNRLFGFVFGNQSHDTLLHINEHLSTTILFGGGTSSVFGVVESHEVGSSFGCVHFATPQKPVRSLLLRLYRQVAAQHR